MDALHQLKKVLIDISVWATVIFRLHQAPVNSVTMERRNMKIRIIPARRTHQSSRHLTLLSSVVLTFLLIFPMTSRATEEPKYNLVETLGDVEIRDYPAYVVAEVLVAGPSEDAGKKAFPILAGYIFGKNKGQRKLEMTAPVTQSAEPVKLAMTAPVIQSAQNNGYLVRFVLPKSVTFATAPEPLDERVKLRELPKQRVAVIRYSGFWSNANYESHLLKLQAGLKAANLTSRDEPIYARYDAPFVPWFMRRNEIWLHIVTP